MENAAAAATIAADSGSLTSGRLASILAAAAPSAPAEAAAEAAPWRAFSSAFKVVGTTGGVLIGTYEVANGVNSGDYLEASHGAVTLGVVGAVAFNYITPGAAIIFGLADFGAQQVFITESDGSRSYGWMAVARHSCPSPCTIPDVNGESNARFSSSSP